MLNRHLLASALLLLGCAADATGVGTEDDAMDIPEPEDGKNDLGYIFTPQRMDDRTEGLTPMLGAGDLEVVADLPYPPGNVAVSEDSRVFFSYQPEGNTGSVKVAELVDGEPVPYPTAEFQDHLDAVLGVRVDRQGRLWMLDHGMHGLHAPRLFAVDIATDEVVVEYTFPRSVGGLGSMFNDFQVSHDGRTIFVADQSVVAQRPAIVVVDLSGDRPRSFRRLDRHASLRNGRYNVYVDGRRLYARALPVKFGIDGFALDQQGTWLYYASLNAGELYRVRARDLATQSVSEENLRAGVQHFATISMTDGMTTDEAGHIYVTDMEHSALLRVDADGNLALVLEDPRLRWPDGFSWSPDGRLYVTACALHQYLHHVVLEDHHVERHAPYQIFRFDPQAACAAGEPCSGHPGH